MPIVRACSSGFPHLRSGLNDRPRAQRRRLSVNSEEACSLGVRKQVETSKRYVIGMSPFLLLSYSQRTKIPVDNVLIGVHIAPLLYIHHVIYGKNFPLPPTLVAEMIVYRRHALKCQDNAVTLWVRLLVHLDCAVDHRHDTVSEL